MPKTGRPRKPRELKIVQGTLRKDRDLGPVDLEVEAPPRPDLLDGEARREWDRIVPVLLSAGLCTQADRAALAAYCQAYSRWVHAEEALAAVEAWTYTTDKGYVGMRPEFSMANQAMKEMRASLVEFGMTPAARTRVRPGKGARKRNPFEAI